MRERISKGIWPIGHRIPSLDVLSGELDVASITVRQAIQLLKNEGLLSPEQGRGTFVRGKPPTHPRMQVETSLRKLADLYRKHNPGLIRLEEGSRMPRLEPWDGSPAPKYRYLRPVGEIRRVFCAPDGTVIYLGELAYRGDFIRLDIDLLA